MGGRMPLLPFGWVGCMFTRQGYLAFFPYVVIPASFRGRTSSLFFFFCMTLRQAPGHVICNMWSLDPEWLQAYGTNSQHIKKAYVHGQNGCVCVHHLNRCKTSYDCRGVWHPCPTTRNEAVDMSGNGNAAGFLYLRLYLYV